MGKLGFAGERFTKVFHVAHAGAGNGLSEDSPLPMVTQDLMDIPAGAVIERCYMLLDVAVTGSTNIDVGDDDDADGYLDSSSSVTLNTPAMYGYDANNAGAYLKDDNGGEITSSAKYYAAAGKELKLDVTGASTAGSFRVVVEGFRHEK